MSRTLGEREIIKTLTAIFGTSRFPLGYDDDVAALPSSHKSWIIIKSDMLVGSTDVPPGMGVEQAARKAVVATVSDFAAKGVQPQALIVSLGLPGSTSLSDVRAAGRGLARGAAEYNCKIVGGDTNQCEDLVIDVIGVGETDSDSVIRRKGARPGDRVAVTGRFGNSGAGLKMLLSKHQPGNRDERLLAKTVLQPKARLKEGLALAKTSAVTSSIDSSDGLAWSLNEIARASGVRILLDRVPVAPEAEGYGLKHRVSPLDLALYGGEEYELVVTAKQAEIARLKRSVPSLIEIGRVASGSPKVVAAVMGRRFRVEARGWEHFRNPA